MFTEMSTTRTPHRLLALATLAGAATLVPTGTAEASVDVSPPVVTVSVRDADRHGWHLPATVPVTFQVRDIGSGVDYASSQVTLSGAQSGTVAIEEIATQVDVSAQGVTTLAYSVLDMEGNRRDGSVVLRLDRTEPTVDLIGMPAGGFVRQGSVVGVSAGCTDAHSGVETCRVESGPTLDTGTLGDHQVEFVAQDVAGNTTRRSATYTVVGAASGPVTTLTPRRAANAQGWFDAPVVVDATATSPYGGTVVAVSQAVNGVTGATTAGSTAAIDVAAEGETVIAARATDGLQIHGAVVTATIKVDSVDPTIDLGPVAPATVGDAVTIPYSCADATSGMASCQVEGPRVLPGGVLDTSVAGTSTVRVHAVDVAGNEVLRSIQVVVEPAPTDPGQVAGAVKSPTTGTASYAIKKNGKGTATVRIVGRDAAPSGFVEVYDGTKLIGRALLRADGTAVVKLKKLAKGKHVLTTRYLGSDTTLPVTTPKKKIRVR